MTATVPVSVFGGPTTLIEYAGLRLLTDPTFDAPGDYDLGSGLVLTKTASSAITLAISACTSVTGVPGRMRQLTVAFTCCGIEA